jgi:hypothetical protein
MTQYQTIVKNRKLSASEDYVFLRSEGLKHIQNLASAIWNDYNIHDPGITILELLCYAITDLGYRTSFSVEDILAYNPDGSEPKEKMFFTANEILPCNTITINDFRKLLVDLDGVKNAWMLKAKQEIDIYADCQKSVLTFENSINKKIELNGLYDVLLEFDVFNDLGDLNDDTITFKVRSGSLKGDTLFISFPLWFEIKTEFTDADEILEVILSDFKNDTAKKRASWNLKIKFKKGAVETTTDVLKVTVDYSKLKNTTGIKSKLEAELQKFDNTGVLDLLIRRIKKILEIVSDVEKSLHAHRNLCEDFVNIKSIQTDDIIICADIEITPQTKPEDVLAEIYFQIKQYLSPDIKFYTLDELVKKGVPSDEIFEGPLLEHGFINDEELEKTNLKKVIYTSDLISIIMDIKGVTAVKSLLISNYDKDGNIIMGNQKWEIEITENHKPRLNIEKSKIVFYKGLLPFYADKQDVLDKLLLLEAAVSMAKLPYSKNNFDIPNGTYREIGDYYTIQHEFPMCYGIGMESLSSAADQKRTAQAKQLKAYLLFFDQLLANYFAQLANVKKLFSMNSTVKQTYFANFLNNEEISNIEELYIDKNTMENIWLKSLTDGSIIEGEKIYFDRRNRFLDHLMSRFCESFTDYIMLMYSLRGRRDEEEIINDKLAMLNEYDIISRDRSKAFNYKDSANIWDTDNVSGLEKRVARLLGINNYNRRNLAEITHFVEVFQDAADPADEFRFRIKDNIGNELLTSLQSYKKELPLFDAIAKLLRHARSKDYYEISTKLSGGNIKFYFEVLDDDGNKLTKESPLFNTYEEAVEKTEEIAEFLRENVDEEGYHLVEHILLRPKANGDKLFSVCLDEDCGECTGSFDPYSFRITFVIPYWADRFFDMNFRRFVENTIRTETPAHIFVKICWVDFDDMKKFEEKFQTWLGENAKEIPDQTELSKNLKELIEAMESLRSVYPEAVLHDCGESETDNSVLLNHTILGTIKSE